MENLHSRIPHIPIYIFLIVAIVGFIDSVYLALAYYTGTPLSCEFLSGCNEVAQSPYSKIAGVSLPTLGIIYYSFTVLNIFFYLFRPTRYSVSILAFLTTLGLLASLYFVYMQIYIIKAICLYCMISAVAAIILFALSIFIRRHHIRQHDSVV